MVKIRREILEWTALLVIAGTLYFTGYHTEVIGRVQSVLIMTGLLKPELEGHEKINLTAGDLALSFIDQDGNLHSLSQFEGKPIFLNFWATWCPPCIAEMPDIDDLYTDLNGDVYFLMISVDDDEQKAWEFLERKNFDFPVYHLSSRRPDNLASQAIPTTFVVSADREILMRREGMAKYNTEEFRNFILEK